MDEKNALKVEKLTKIYSEKSSNKIKALNNLNLEVKEGEIFGLLGPNGAGKTTFLNILAGTVIKNSGSVNVWGYDLDQIHARLDLLLELFHRRSILMLFLVLEIF